MTDPTTGRKCCATCKHWDQFPDAPQFGLCLNIPKEGKAETLLGNPPPTGTGPFGKVALPTTDLTVCSKWEQKDDE